MIELNNIYNEDCLEGMKKIEAGSVNLVLTSPPYFQLRKYNGVGIGNEKTEEEYINNLVKIFKECLRVTSDDGHIVFNLGDKYLKGSLSLMPYKFAIRILEEFPVLLVNQVNWIKTNPVPKQDKNKLTQATEPFFIFAKNKDYYFNKSAYLKATETKEKKKTSTKKRSVGKKYFDLIKESELTEEQKRYAEEELIKTIQKVEEGEIDSFRMKIRGIHALPYGGQQGGRMSEINKNGFTIIKMYGEKMKRDVIECPVETIKGNKHPAVYPKYICKEIISLLTRQNDLVVDPFCGSGTTCLVAKELGRKYIGFDISEDYCQHATKRVNS